MIVGLDPVGLERIAELAVELGFEPESVIVIADEPFPTVIVDGDGGGGIEGGAAPELAGNDAPIAPPIDTSADVPLCTMKL